MTCTGPSGLLVSSETHAQLTASPLSFSDLFPLSPCAESSGSLVMYLHYSGGSSFGQWQRGQADAHPTQAQMFYHVFSHQSPMAVWFQPQLQGKSSAQPCEVTQTAVLGAMGTTQPPPGSTEHPCFCKRTWGALSFSPTPC